MIWPLLIMINISYQLHQIGSNTKTNLATKKKAKDSFSFNGMVKWEGRDGWYEFYGP